LTNGTPTDRHRHLAGLIPLAARAISREPRLPTRRAGATAARCEHLSACARVR
jgi:hypothetical protein